MPGSRTVDPAHVALRVTVEPDAVAYTTLSPTRSTGPLPWLAISTNSSDALPPPVCTSETTSVDAGHGTDAARATSAPIGRAAAGPPARHSTTRATRAFAPRPDANHR